MTHLTPEQYEALPEEEKRYWKPETLPDYEPGCKDHFRYSPIMIPLAEAERMIKEDMYDVAATAHAKSYNAALKVALTKLQQLAK